MQGAPTVRGLEMSRRERRAHHADGRERELSARLHLLEHNASAVQLMISKLAFADGGQADLVAVIIDPRDEVGSELSVHLGVAGEAERLAGPNRIPTILASVGRLDAAAAFLETHPRVAAGLRSMPPSTHSPVIVIANGGMTLAFVPRIAMPTIGEA